MQIFTLKIYFAQEVDFAIGDFTITEDRSTVVDFMTSFYGETKTFIIRTLKEDKMMIYTHVFKVYLFLVLEAWSLS